MNCESCTNVMPLVQKTYKSDLYSMNRFSYTSKRVTIDYGKRADRYQESEQDKRYSHIKPQTIDWRLDKMEMTKPLT